MEKLCSVNITQCFRAKAYSQQCEIKLYIGISYRFHKRNDSQYVCAPCKTLGKSRVVTVKDGSIHVYSRKHPKDDHHKDCRPIADVKLYKQSPR